MFLISDGTLNDLTHAIIIDDSNLADAITRFAESTGTQRDQIVVNQVSLPVSHDEPYGDWNTAAAIAADSNRPMAERSAALKRIDELTGETGGDYSPADVEKFTKERAETLGLAEQARLIEQAQTEIFSPFDYLLEDGFDAQQVEFMNKAQKRVSSGQATSADDIQDALGYGIVDAAILNDTFFDN